MQQCLAQFMSRTNFDIICAKTIFPVMKIFTIGEPMLAVCQTKSVYWPLKLRWPPTVGLYRLCSATCEQLLEF